MKRSQKIEIACFTAIIVAMFFVLFSFKSPEPPPQSSSYNKITSFGNVGVYRLNVDGSQYIVVIGSSGVAITPHR